MNRNTRSNIVFQRMEWVIGSISLSLLIGAAGLALFAQQDVGPATMATKLLALYLASWSYVLGLVGLFLSLAWWLVSWRRVRLTRSAMSRDSSAEPRRRRLEKLELEARQFLEDGVVTGIPDRSASAGHDRNKTDHLTRV